MSFLISDLIHEVLWINRLSLTSSNGMDRAFLEDKVRALSWHGPFRWGNSLRGTNP